MIVTLCTEGERLYMAWSELLDAKQPAGKLKRAYIKHRKQCEICTRLDSVRSDEDH